MNILFVNLFPVEANTSAMMRNMALVKGLVNNNYTIDFVTTPTSRFQTIIDNTVDEKINIIRLDENKVYTKIVSKSRKSHLNIKEKIIPILRKTYHIISLYDYTYRIAKNININMLPKKTYDYIISSSDPKSSHIAVQQLIKQGLTYGAWIQYWGDPMTLDITSKTILPKWYIKKVESKIIRNANKIIYVSPLTLNEQKKLFSKYSNKMFFLPIPYSEEKIYPKTYNTKYEVGYFGAYNSKIRNIMPLYNTCRDSLRDKVELIIMGDSNLELSESENIKILPRGDVSLYECKVDLLVCILNIKGSQIPGKLYHYAATNKPILVILDGNRNKEIGSYLSKYKRYTSCNNNELEIKNAIIQFMQNETIYYPCKNFNSSVIASNLLEL